MDKIEHIKHIKERYRSQLAPFLDLLRIRKHDLAEKEWHDAVNKTAGNVLASPDQYLSGLTQKNNAMVDAIIKDLFRELLDGHSEPNVNEVTQP